MVDFNKGLKKLQESEAVKRHPEPQNSLKILRSKARHILCGAE